MLSKTLKAALALLCVSGAAGFTSVPQSTQQFSSSALHMKNEDGMKKAAASFLAGALILSNVAGVEPALAVLDNNVPDFGSSQVVAARSGGRAGGRAAPRASSSYRSAPSSYRSAPSSRSTTVINRTYVTPAPMYSAPSVYVAPPLYSPGLGLGLGLNAINQIGNDMRDYRQESEIQRSRSELENAKYREAEMEARLRQLESQNQVQQLTPAQQQQMLMQQQMMLQQQQQLQQAAPAAAQ